MKVNYASSKTTISLGIDYFSSKVLGNLGSTYWSDVYISSSDET